MLSTCMHVAVGYLPNIWLPKEPAAAVIPPYKVGPNASAEEHEEARQVRQAHPLFRDVSLRLLVEVINSRLFTTVCTPALGPLCACTAGSVCSHSTG